MKVKKRYLLMKSLPDELPSDAKYLFQNEYGFVIKAGLESTKILRKDAILVSGSIKKLKHPKALNSRTRKIDAG